MEAALNESTPLLGDGSSPKQQLIEGNLPEEPTMPHRYHSFDEQEPLDGNVDISNKPVPLAGNDAISREQTPPVGEGTSNSDKSPITCSPRTFERNRNVFSLEEAVQELYSAWLRNRTPKRDITLDYFTIKELCAMSKAWEKVTSGRRDCSYAPEKITEALATTIAKELLSAPECVENDISIDFHMEFTTTKNLLNKNLLEDWAIIEAGVKWFPVRYIETIFEDSDEQHPSVSEFWIKQVELYDKARDFFLNPKLQALLNFLLFFWPLSILAIGSKYMECPMGHHLSYLLMILGCVGCVAIVYRLAVLYITSLFRDFYNEFSGWEKLRGIEFTFLIVFIVQAFHFFDIDLIVEVGTNQCVKNFYKETLMLNYVSIPLVSAYVLVYSVIECAYRIDIWHWIFRHL